jgi:hypothetical protein
MWRLDIVAFLRVTQQHNLAIMCFLPPIDYLIFGEHFLELVGIFHKQPLEAIISSNINGYSPYPSHFLAQGSILI